MTRSYKSRTNHVIYYSGYTLALQQILTGVYIAELCLIGLFSLRQATGPTVLVGILFVTTIVFHYTTNRYFDPLEKYLPADISAGFESESEEQQPLLSSAEEGESDALQNTESNIRHLSRRTHVPQRVISPVVRFFAPHVFTSHAAMKAWLREGDFDEGEHAEYSEEEVKRAYLNPAYTSKMPIVWLARDELGVSASEAKENEKAGLSTSDKGAWIDGKGKLHWSVDDFSEVPVFKPGQEW